MADNSQDDTRSCQGDTEKKAHLRPPPYMYFVALCASLNSVGLGYDVGVTSGVLIHLQEDLGFSAWELGFFAGSLHFVAAASCLLSHGAADRFGRRRTFILTQLLQILGIAITAVGHSFPVIIIGRFLIGAGFGVGLSIDPLYIAEAAPASHRGELTSWSELSLNLGITLGFFANWSLAGLPQGVNWRVMVALGSVLPLLLVVLALTVMPESPRWLMMQGQDQLAADVLRRTHPEGADINTLVEQMRADVEAHSATGSVTWAALLCPPDSSSLKALLVATGVAVAQQLNGSESVVTYSPTIFKQAGVATSPNSLFAMTMLVGFVKTFFVLVSMCFLDSVGRRPLLVSSTAAMAVSMCVLAAGSSFAPSWLAVVGVLCFMALFELGVGPVTWLLAAELFPSSRRAKAMSLCVCLNRLTSGCIALTFLPLSEALGGQATYFFMFAAFTALAAGLMFQFVPETKQKTLEELSAKTEVKFGPDCLPVGVMDA
eukprot:CAMPEP_0115099220 /NCGR_PEP_ID=MMETSP0227-20121206/31702_1 /TAXON_ID=89957 /ORGANISM="Polarella glacialis, Strain CCMP 1383" /LENGTH=487 /DNA_ID=CAMNT_0002494129 /DNA_START=45 /DNA_END=1508 /DNA_ORIENTATION=-